MDITVTVDDENVRLDRFLRHQLGQIGQSALEKMMRGGKIRVNGGKQKTSYRLQCDDKIMLDDFAAGQFAHSSDASSGADAGQKAADSKHAQQFLASIELERSEDWIAYNKPAGLAVQGGSKTRRHIDGYLQQLPGVRAKLVHRIDKDTSGLLLVARHDSAARRLAGQFKTHDITKCYLAVVVGDPGLRGVIDAPLLKSGHQEKQKMVIDEQGLESLSLFRTLYVSASGLSLVAMMPVTGRTHQLRAHMAHLGCPILGDGKYGGVQAHPGGGRYQLHLHAHFIQLADSQILTAPLPDHINNTISQSGAGDAIPQTMPVFQIPDGYLHR